MWIYESHLGGLYAMDDLADLDFLYCEECGDYDEEIGEADTAEEAWWLLKGMTDIDGSGGFAYDYVKEFLEETFGDSSMMPAYTGEVCDPTPRICKVLGVEVGEEWKHLGRWFTVDDGGYVYELPSGEPADGWAVCGIIEYAEDIQRGQARDEENDGN